MYHAKQSKVRINPVVVPWASLVAATKDAGFLGTGRQSGTEMKVWVGFAPKGL
jgi:hypothetical protein